MDFFTFLACELQLQSKSITKTLLPIAAAYYWLLLLKTCKGVVLLFSKQVRLV